MTEVMTLSTGCSGGLGGGKGHVSVVALLLAAIRRSVASACRLGGGGGGDEAMAELRSIEIGFPTDVRHVAHVTFDRFEGFLGLPDGFDEFGRVPSASASVFGVSAESMQCCYDSNGNSVPTILLLMQERLYLQEGLKAEGIFRINPENSREEQVREQLNKGVVPDDIDVHCLAGLIKAWFRELPEGVLDGLSPEQVLQCNTEDEFVELVELLLPTPAALLNWAINLMADVVEEEDLNKMNARNIAMVFAPNMTQMSDPLTALMHAVQVMNLLKALILKTLRERDEATREGEYSAFSCSPSSEPQGDDDDDFDSEQDMNMSGEPRIVTLDDRDVNYSSCQEELEVHISRTKEGDDTMKDIEDHFLRRLEWKERDGNLGGDDSLDLSYGLSLSWSKRESSSSSSSEDEFDTEARSPLTEDDEQPEIMMDLGQFSALPLPD